jgi:alkanesulfonate monooxygenase SsuD/methylene tetrahydromethanopterin reductase-like flavin-dependent oxidoreductase (luciferase family)
MFRPEWAPEELPRFARDAERHGLGELWLVEDCFLTGGLTMAATALAATDALAVGIGLLPAPLRNPALAAMEISGLARLHPGRLAVAFGHGVEPWMRQIGARPANRIAALEEIVDAVRRLLAGEQVTIHGRHVHIDDVRLGHAPAEPPRILVGTTGERGLRVAGRVADGVLLPEGSTPEAVRWARATAGRGETVVYAWLSLDDDRTAAEQALRPDLDRWREMGLYPNLYEHAGGGGEPIAVAGDPADCARAIGALWDAGADGVVVVPRHADHDAQVARFAADVQPLL